LDEIATSIKKLVVYLDSRETDGRPFTASEIDAIASELGTHVEELLAASKSLRDERTDG
jgi:hypothetical protein